MARSDIKIFSDMNFGIVHDKDENPNIIDFQLHNHNDVYEILLLLDGDCEFCVEGNTYRLQPRDMIFARPFEMHKMVCLTDKTYERIILYIKKIFFEENRCEKFLDIFQNRPLGTGNRIPRDIADKELKDCMHRICGYCVDAEYEVARHTLYEFLYLMNKCADISDNFYVKDERVRNIIMYINEHLSEDIKLDILASKFFVAKPYMCKIFKKHTGYTISQYITYKRILLAQELRRGGQSLLRSSIDSGFNSYANFYKAYIRQTGKSPSSIT